jgi:hypothetical protein
MLIGVQVTPIGMLRSSRAIPSGPRKPRDVLAEAYAAVSTSGTHTRGVGGGITGWTLLQHCAAPVLQADDAVGAASAVEASAVITTTAVRANMVVAGVREGASFVKERSGWEGKKISRRRDEEDLGLECRQVLGKTAGICGDFILKPPFDECKSRAVVGAGCRKRLTVAFAGTGGRAKDSVGGVACAPGLA